MDARALPTMSLLVVEDDKEAQDIICRMLAKKFPAFPLRSADNGVMGLQLFLEHHPDIVVTDIHMPVMDGIEMAGKIRATGLDTCFIVLTGYSDKQYLDKFSKIGFCEYIVKPVDFAQLFAAIVRCSREIDSGR